MSWLPLIIQLISGAAGGNLVGRLAKNLDLGTLWNSVAGIAGGGIGGYLLNMLGMGGVADAAASSSLDIGSILGSVAGGGVGGGALMSIVAVVKNMMGSK